MGHRFIITWVKSKTDFKQMYLVDATAYNGMSRVDTSIILGRSDNKVSPPTINVLAPVTSKVENSKTDTRSIGVVTESPPKVKKYDQTSQTPILNNNVRSARDDNHSPQDNNPSTHLHHSSPIENSIIQIENS